MTNRPRPPDPNNNKGGHQRSRSVPADFTRPVTLKFGRQLSVLNNKHVSIVCIFPIILYPAGGGGGELLFM